MWRLGIVLLSLALALATISDQSWGQARNTAGSYATNTVLASSNSSGLTVSLACHGAPFLTAMAFASSSAAVVFLEGSMDNAGWTILSVPLNGARGTSITNVTTGYPFVRLRSSTTAGDLDFQLACKF